MLPFFVLFVHSSSFFFYFPRHTANHECPRPLVDKIWTSIVQQERRNIRNQSFAAVSASLSRKVEVVGKLSSLSLKVRKAMFISSLVSQSSFCLFKVFPVDTVVELLEGVSFDMQSSNGEWVPQLLLGCGVSCSALFDFYHHLFVAEENRPKKLHYSAPLRYVIERWHREESDDFRAKRLPFVVDDVIVRLEELGADAAPELAKWKALSLK